MDSNSERKESSAGLNRRTLLGAAAVGGLALASGVLAASPEEAHAAIPRDGLAATRISLTLDGFELATFSDLVSLTTEVRYEPVSGPIKEAIQKKTLGQVQVPTVVLKRGMTSSLDLWAWHESVLLGNVAAARKSVTLNFYNASGNPIVRYHLENAWPAKLETGVEEGTALLTETATFLAQAIQRISAS